MLCSYRFVLVIVSAICCADCGRDPDPAEARILLTREYRLVLNSRSVNPELDSSNLTLSPDGTSTQRCRFKNGRVDQFTGTWEFSPPRHVHLSRLKDCAGVFGASLEADGANLIVEFHDPPIIVLNPDIVGVFYEGVH